MSDDRGEGTDVGDQKSEGGGRIGNREKSIIMEEVKKDG